MNCFLVFTIPILVLYFVLQPVSCANHEPRQRLGRGLRDMTTTADHKRPSKISPFSLHGKSGSSGDPVKRPSRQTLPQLARNLEAFLQKIIPNHNLVQDLMGYVTMTNPNTNPKIISDKTYNEKRF